VTPTVQLHGFKPVAQAKSARRSTAVTAFAAHGHKGKCKHKITIDCLRAIYQIPVATTATPGNELGIAVWDDFLKLNDLKEFFKKHTSPRIPSHVAPEVVWIDGGATADTTKPGPESALDVQTAYSIIYPQGVRLYQSSDRLNDHNFVVSTYLVVLIS